MTRFSRYTVVLNALFFVTVFLVGFGHCLAQSTATAQVSIANDFGTASGVAVDPVGNVYATDSAYSTLLEFTGGNGAASPLLSGLSTPGQVAVDASRNVYVANGSSNVVYKYAYSSGSLNLNSPISIGSGLGTVTGVAVDISGNIYIVDSGKKQVVKISGTTQTVIASGLASPQQIAVDKVGNVYIADAGANTVIYLPAGGGAASTVGSGLSAPAGVAVDLNNNVYIADTGNNVIKKVPYSSGAPVTASQITLSASVTSPTSLAVDTLGSLYIAGSGTLTHFSNGAIYFGLLPVSESSKPTPVTITFTSAVAPAAIKVVTSGLSGYDFNDAGGGTCAVGTTYAAGSSCIVNVTFTPIYAGARAGAIVFYDSSNKVVSSTYIGGGGLGPVLTFDPSTTSAPSTTLSTSITLSGPHGVKFDSVGNTFFADTGNNRIVELSTSGIATVALATGTIGMNDVAIDGAGNLIIPDLSGGRILSYPYENGTWSLADVVVLGTGYTRPRVANVDIAGNIYFCDTGNNKIYELPNGGTQIQLNSGLTKGCYGVAVDLYGNLGVTDNSASAAYYIPVNGAAAYSVGSGLSAPWGVTFDASGSMFVANTTSTTSTPLTRIPNENGMLSTTDQQQLTYNKPFSIAVSPIGDIISVPYYGKTAPTTYNSLTRSAITHAFGSLAVGKPATAVAIIVGNSGNQAPVYTQTAGFALLGDVDDFSLTATVVGTKTTPLPIYPICDFSSQLQPGYTCYIGVDFTPTSLGVTRAATAQLPTQALTTPVINLTGTGPGTAATVDAGLALTLTSPTGTPAIGQSLTITATANAAATGAVTLSVDNTAISSVELTNGSAVFTILAGLRVGSHTLTATYAGDTTYKPTATAPSLLVTVVSATPTLTLVASGSNIDAAQAEQFTGNIATQSGLPTPSGTFTFFDGSTSIGMVTVSSGTGSFTSTSLTSGTHKITFTYSGDTVYASGTSNSVTVTVRSYVTTSTSLTNTPAPPSGGYVYGTALTATAAISSAQSTPALSGSVIFNLDGVVQSQTVSNNSATVSLSPSAGSHILIASYSGDSTYDSSMSNSIIFTTLQANTTTTLASSSTAFYAGTKITLTATVSSSSTIPTGSVTFKNGASTLGTATLANGIAKLITSSLPSGTENITASYAGDTNAVASVSLSIPIHITINQTTLTVSSSSIIVYSGTTPTITATLGDSAPSTVVVPPSGVVTFMVNGTAVGTQNMATSGTAALPLSLPAGINYITATYAGDNDYASSATTATYSVYVAPTSGWAGDYAITATPNPITINIGTAATITVTATPSNNYYGFVQITCAGLPIYTNCMVDPDQLTLDGTGVAKSTTLTIRSQAPVLVGHLDTKRRIIQMCGASWGGLLLLLLLGTFRRGRKVLRSTGVNGILTVLLLSFGIWSMTACGGHPAASTPAGTYAVNVSATGSGGLAHTYSVQMTFK